MKEGKPREGGGESRPPFQNSHGGEMKGSHRGRGGLVGRRKRLSRRRESKRWRRMVDWLIIICGGFSFFF